MFNIADINIQGLTNEYIDDFRFVETMQFGFQYGYVVLNKILTTEEREYFLNNGQTINLYPEASFEKLEENINEEKTIIYYNQNIASMPLKNGTDTTLTSTNITNIISKIMLDYQTSITLSGTEYPLFSGTVTSGQHHFSKLSTILALTNFGQIKLNWQDDGTAIYKIKDFPKYLYSLSYDENIKRINSYLTTNEQNEISDMQADVILNTQNFEIKKHYYFNYLGSFTLLLKDSLYSYENYNSQSYVSKTYDMSCIVSGANNFLNFLKKWFLSAYHGIVGKIYQEHLHLEVGDAVIFEEYKGLINTIVRTPHYDEIHFGFPPFKIDAKESYYLSKKY